MKGRNKLIHLYILFMYVHKTIITKRMMMMLMQPPALPPLIGPNETITAATAVAVAAAQRKEIKRN